jgi:hypothetical protein
MTTVKRRSVRTAITDLTRHAQTYLFNRDQSSQIDKIKKRENTWLKKHIDEEGKLDSKGNRNIYFDTPLTIGNKTYYGMQQRRMAPAEYMDSEEVKEFAENELDPAVRERVVYKKLIEVIDTEELYVLVQEHEMTEEQLRALIHHHKPQFQLWPIEEAPYEDDDVS